MKTVAKKQDVAWIEIYHYHLHCTCGHVTKSKEWHHADGGAAECEKCGKKWWAPGAVDCEKM